MSTVVDKSNTRPPAKLDLKEEGQDSAVKVRLCRYFGLGRCEYGDSCKYVHDKQVREEKLADSEAKFKTKPCRYFLMAACEKSTGCPFIHDVEAQKAALKAAADELTSNAPQVSTGGKKSKKKGKQQQNVGKNFVGANKHNKQKDKQRNQQQQHRQEQQRRNSLNAYNMLQQQQMFMQQQQQQQQQPQQQQGKSTYCRYFSAGQCHRGDSCQYIHDVSVQFGGSNNGQQQQQQQQQQQVWISPPMVHRELNPNNITPVQSPATMYRQLVPIVPVQYVTPHSRARSLSRTPHDPQQLAALSTSPLFVNTGLAPDYNIFSNSPNISPNGRVLHHQIPNSIMNVAQVSPHRTSHITPGPSMRHLAHDTYYTQNMSGLPLPQSPHTPQFQYYQAAPQYVYAPYQQQQPQKPQSPIVVQPIPSQEPQQPQQEQVATPQLCLYFQQGKCLNGETCAYSHGATKAAVDDESAVAVTAPEEDTKIETQ